VLAVRYLLCHLETRCNTLAQLGTVRQIHDWLEWPEAPLVPEIPAILSGDGDGAGQPERDIWVERAEKGWSEEVRAHLTEACAAILRRPEWPDRVRSAHRSGDVMEKERAWTLAPTLGVDLWEELFAQLAADPLNASAYWKLMQSRDTDRLGRVIAFAEKA